MAALRHFMRSLRLLLVLLLAGATGLAASRLAVERERPYDIQAVPGSQLLAWVFLGHRTLAADLNWLRIVQYIGERRGDERGWDKLHPLVDVVTDLDPGHGYVYQVVSTILSSLGRIEESNRILEKGMREVPGRYILPYHRAFNAFYYEDDWETAGKFAEHGRSDSRRTRPRPAERARLLREGQAGRRRRRVPRAGLAEARDPDTRRAIEGQLRQARLEWSASRLEDAIADWRRRYVIGPLSLSQLVAGGAHSIDSARSSGRRTPPRLRRPGAFHGQPLSLRTSRAHAAANLSHRPSVPETSQP